MSRLADGIDNLSCDMVNPTRKMIDPEKIKLAKNLLLYSDSSYSEIASTLGFSSQSHLGSVFRKETGLTLQQYRKRFIKLSGKGRETVIVP